MCITLRNCDCLEYMRTVPDNYYDVCIADPPYGIGRDWEKRDWRSRAKYRDCRYMNVRPPKEFFDEMRRISKDWIVWGWNYFTDILPPTNYLIVWDKMSTSNHVFKYSKCEIACTSFKVPCNLVSCGWDGYRRGSETGTKKIHPHQKPVDLYRWLLGAYLGDPGGPEGIRPVCRQRGTCSRLPGEVGRLRRVRDRADVLRGDDGADQGRRKVLAGRRQVRRQGRKGDRVGQTFAAGDRVCREYYGGVA